MAEYLAPVEQLVLMNQPVIFTASIPCTKGYIYHEDDTGIFILRGITNNCFARYQVVYNGNISVPTGGTVGPIAVSIALNGEARPSSTAIVTPAAVEEYNNVTSTAIVTVPRGCCFTLSVRAIPAADDATTASINVQNSNLVISRIA
jgi:hypothetical protein